MNHSAICERIPHHGSMCLLEEVMDWDEQSLSCRATSHRLHDNPLRGHGRLAAVAGVEYAGQAMALHGGLTGDEGAPRTGYLASVRNLDMVVDRLDDIESDLEIRVERMAGGADSFMYAFSVSADNRVLLSGRAAVRLME
ncbi:MAG: hydroxymyristoyl-ACP dehydratase [Gammaproteobacteria bacterium]|nr:hydroxymyristoyl-ACP dehydratase [Gammaproteobacteria bacterium]